MATGTKNAGGNIVATIGCLFMLIILLGGLNAIRENVWGEQEGFIKTDDCRATVMVEQGSYHTWFKKFTCTLSRPKKEKFYEVLVWQWKLTDQYVKQSICMTKPQKYLAVTRTFLFRV